MLEKKDIRLGIYYIVLLLLYIYASFAGLVINSLGRFVILALIVLPPFIYRLEWLPAVTTVFYSIATSNYTSTLLPVGPNTFLIILILGVVLKMPKLKYPISKPLILLLVLTLFVNLTTYGAWESVSSALIWIITFFYYVPFNEKKQVTVFSYGFVFVSFVISVSRILLGSNYTGQYDSISGLDRTILIDVNYAACVVGMGIVSGMILLFNGDIKKNYIKLFISFTIVISLITLAFNASRTSFLALAPTVIVLLLYSKIKLRYKILCSLLVVALLFFMYYNSYLDLLLFRIENDYGVGSTRTEIWQLKIKAFFDGDFLSRLFGYGYEPARNMGCQMALHNDFLAFCCEYGYLGLVLFLSLFIIPFKHCGFRKSTALASLVYLLCVTMTLEPFAAGRVPYYAYWFYTLLLSLEDENSSLQLDR